MYVFIYKVGCGKQSVLKSLSYLMHQKHSILMYCHFQVNHNIAIFKKEIQNQVIFKREAILHYPLKLVRVDEI